MLLHELDQLGARAIAIDYQLITTNALLRDEHQRRRLIAGVGDLLVENIWLRVSGFGASSTGVGTRHYIDAVRDLHELGRPFVADCAGGFAVLAALAFGAVGGICHGVGQKESFQANLWKQPAAGGGGARRIYIPELDRHFSEDQLNAIFAARGGRSRFGCNDANCCPHGIDDARKRLVRLRDALDDLDSQGGIATRSPAVSFRGGGGAVAAVLGR
jgi:hypothetical protein